MMCRHTRKTKSNPKTHSIYIGDFFYYHMTSQSEFLKLVDSSQVEEYVIEMLNMHIETIINKNTVEFVYVNNAMASHLLCKAEKISDGISKFVHEYKGHKYTVLLGSMLSGQRAMDVFSKARLVQEMRDTLKGI